jgi:hypothetical protein
MAGKDPAGIGAVTHSVRDSVGVAASVGTAGAAAGVAADAAVDTIITNPSRDRKKFKIWEAAVSRLCEN